MAMTASNMLPLGHKAANFSLPDTQDNIVNLNDFEGSKGLVVAFICNHCPYVIHIAPQLAKVAQEYQTKGIAFVSLNSNDIEQYPEDDMPYMIEEKHNRQYPFAYLLDKNQEVAKSYSAADLFYLQLQLPVFLSEMLSLHSLFKSKKHLIRFKRLGYKIIGTLLHCLYSKINRTVSRHHYNRRSP
jgi:peroxiredoxin